MRPLGLAEEHGRRVIAAIEAIPPGRWTSYGELAELAGASAQAVGGVVGNLRDASNANRRPHSPRARAAPRSSTVASTSPGKAELFGVGRARALSFQESATALYP
jgi:alkylated DNA nucleotide flippase Atl1